MFCLIRLVFRAAVSLRLSRSCLLDIRRIARPAILVVFAQCAAIAVAQSSPLIESNGTERPVAYGFYEPFGLAADQYGDLFVADADTFTISEIVAVNGTIPPNPLVRVLYRDGSNPQKVAVDRNGNVYFTDLDTNSNLQNNTVKEILAVNGTIPSSPTVVQLGSGLFYPRGIAIDKAGDVFVADSDNNAVKEFLAVNGSVPPSPTILTIGSGWYVPEAIAVDANGDVFVADSQNHAVKEILAVDGVIPPSPTIVTLASGYCAPDGLSLDSIGNLYFSAYCDASVFKIQAVNGQFPAVPQVQKIHGELSGVEDVAVDPNGAIYAGGVFSGAYVPRVYPTPALASNVGSTAGPIPLLFSFWATTTTIGSIEVRTQGTASNEFTDSRAGSCRVNTVYYGSSVCTVELMFTPTVPGPREGAVILRDVNGNAIATGYVEATGMGPAINFAPPIQTTLFSNLPWNQGIAVDGIGNVYIAWTSQNEVLKETYSAGTFTQAVIPTSALNGPVGIAVDASGGIYIADAGNGRVLKETPSLSGYTESIVAGGINTPMGVTVDGNGIVYIACENGTVLVETPSYESYNNLVSIPTGVSSASGIAVDGSGNLYIIANSTSGSVVKETVSGNSYIQSSIPVPTGGVPSGVAVDGFGNLFVSYIDANDAGQVLEESPTASGYVQSAIPTSGLNQPYGIATDSLGNVYVANSGGYDVIKLDFADPPSLNFATTTNGSISADSPQTVTLENIGNADLTFPILSSGYNPSIANNFTLNSNAPGACPVIGSSFATPGTLAAGTSCTLPISFAPTVAGTLSGSLVLTDNNLNAGAPGYAQQAITLSGTATPATPTVSWPTPAAIPYGTALSAAQLNATASVPGTFTYSPAAGTVLSAGPHTLSVTFAPTDATDYTTATTTVSITVNQLTPVLTWATPAAITYGTTLSATQLNATASVPGTFGYSPAAGAVPSAGVQTLTATFVPTDTTDYTGASASVQLTVNPTAPVFTPPAGNYATAQSVSISDTTPGTTIYYTTNGATPSASSTPFTTPIAVSTAETIKAIAVGAGNTQSAVASANYTFGVVGGGNPFGTAFPAAENPLSQNGAWINGRVTGLVWNNCQSTPGFAFGTQPGTGVSDDSICVLAGKWGPNQSAQVKVKINTTSNAQFDEVELHLNTTIAANSVTGYEITCSVAPNYSYLQIVRMDGAQGQYSVLDGRSVTCVNGDVLAAVRSGNTITAYRNGSAVLSVTDSTYLGGSPGMGFFIQTLSGTAAAADAGFGVTAFSASDGAAAVPSFSPGAGTYSSSQTVSISDLTVGSKIYYTTNGTTPTTSSTVYSAPITVSSSETLEAIAVATGISQSAVASAAYTISQQPVAPTFSPAGGTYGSAQSVSISEAVQGATIYYTTNGTAPTTSSTRYVGPVQVTASETLQAIAVVSGQPTSQVGSATYQILQTPTITWNAPAAISYGTALSPAQLNATASVAGTFAYSPAAGTVLSAGAQTLSVTFTPTDTTDYATATATVQLSVNQVAPTLTWPAPAAITYGTALSAAQLNATASVPGTFAYSPTAGTVPKAGSQTLSVTFTPTDATDYAPVSTTVSLTVNKAAPTITWSAPAAITYGVALGAAQLNATASTAGTFSYSPASGTVLTAGTQALSTTFTPTDSADYTLATASVSIIVNKAAPVITWPTPAGVPSGTALSSTQLDATANVPGTFVYSPAAGTVPPVGTDTLSVTFTPTDTTNYSVATASVQLVVGKTTPTITWPAPAAITYGTALSAAQLDATASVPGTFVYNPAAGTVLTAGPHTLSVTFTPTDTTDYTTATGSVSINVSQATPILSWATPAAITYGTALSGTQLNATSSVPGTFAYNPAAGTVLTAGSHTLTVTFTPTDTTDFTSAMANVSLTVNKATPIITWPTPAPVAYGTALSATQLDASANVAGTFVYIPAAGTIPAQGTDTLATTFTPADATDYNSATASVLLTVNAAPDFTLSASPSTVSVAQGRSVTSTITVKSSGGFSGSVSLSKSTLPSGVTVSFSTNPTKSISTMTIKAGTRAALGTYTITVTGTSGGLVHTTTVSLAVTK